MAKKNKKTIGWDIESNLTTIDIVERSGSILNEDIREFVEEVRSLTIDSKIKEEAIREKKTLSRKIKDKRNQVDSKDTKNKQTI